MHLKNLTEAPAILDASSGLTSGEVELKPRRSWIKTWIKWTIPFAFLLAALFEMRTSALQSRLLPQYAAKLSYQDAAGPSDQIIFPKGGPFDERRGYARIPDFQQRLQDQGFVVTTQPRFSPELMRLAGWGIAPPYREATVRGLTIRGADGSLLHDASANARVFQSFEEIPELIVNTLLFIENRELGNPATPHTNPVVEWDRFTKAALLQVGNELGLRLRQEGGSTLAIQLEKYRHSPSGRTGSTRDKLQQIAGASLKAYRDGPDTTGRRKEIILDYLNTMPLAAAPYYGELFGLGDGLFAWFQADLAGVSRALSLPATPREIRLRSFKQVLALLLAVRAPTHYLVVDRSTLEMRVVNYTELLSKSGVIDRQFATDLNRTPLVFSPRAPLSPSLPFAQLKASNAIRTQLVGLLGVRDFYDLDRLDLEVATEIDPVLQAEVNRVFQQLGQREYVEKQGLIQDSLLSRGDPANVLYSLMLFEKTSQENLLRVQADSLDRPFDLNNGMKLELGSTAKLRTLTHYLELVALLYEELVPLSSENPLPSGENAADPITQWARRTLDSEPEIDLTSFLEKALDRTYSASPNEAFFTGGGSHTFRNFDSKDNNRVLSVREATRFSTNLVFIRLMRDLVRFHQARLPYDAEAVLNQTDHPERRRLLEDSAEGESKDALLSAYRSFRNLPPDELVERLLAGKAKSARNLAILFFAWHGGSEAELRNWIERQIGPITPVELQRLSRSFGNPRLNISDYGYLIGLHPLRVWCAGEIIRESEISWGELWSRSTEARRVASVWLFQTRNRKAQDLRLRIRIEQEAFARMTPYWRRLGFPFQQLVPSLATAIGSSSDRPAALAELMGIIVNDGVRRPTFTLRDLQFGRDTPYHTVFETAPASGEQVIPADVARAVREVLAEVVETGTARRIAGAFATPEGVPIVIGGKTGSGDNRFRTFGRGGQPLSSQAVNRTATFVFYIGDKYFGALTAFVPGREAEDYRFTSALPVTVMKLLLPAIRQAYFRLPGDIDAS